MQRPTNLFSKDKNEIISLEYRPSLTSNVLSYVENGVTYPLGGKFRNFAVKVVMTAKDPSVTPYVTNIKAIAVPAG